MDDIDIVIVNNSSDFVDNRNIGFSLPWHVHDSSTFNIYALNLIDVLVENNERLLEQIIVEAIDQVHQLCFGSGPSERWYYEQYICFMLVLIAHLSSAED